MILEDINFDLIRIRVHHLLCLQGFQGYGYDQAFTIRMGEIIRILKLNPSLKIEIVTEADDICLACPNLAEKRCIHHLKIKEMDLNILNNASLEDGQIITFKAALNIIDQELSSETINTVCNDCIWIDKCLFFLNYHDL